ncbi:MAG: transporter substrate-binding domain-containing protein [Sulfurospirillaceae bacterium]|nr:transporter substrate-binding domain-containing protein [Sulfurospirillaceae bacterium]
MRFKICFIVIFLIVPMLVSAQDIDLSDSEKEYIENIKSIKVCCSSDWMPLEKLKNELHEGIVSDYIKVFQETLGVPFEFIDAGCLEDSPGKIKDKKCDIFSLTGATEQRQEYMDFTKSYLDMPVGIATSVNETFYANIAMLKDKKMAIIKGSSYVKVVEKNYPNIHLVYVDSSRHGLEMVRLGKVDGFIDALPSLSYHIQNSYVGMLKISGKFNEDWKLSVGVKKDKPLLFSIFEKLVASVPAEKHQDIMNKWVSIQSYNTTDYGRINKILAIVSCLLFFVAYRQ